MKVAFLHPDLGIGGAERLVVDAAVGLQRRGHEVTIFTSHHSPDHCFKETKDGTLRVIVYGDFFPRHIFGRFHILFAILRMLYVSLCFLLLHNFSLSYNAIFADQVSAAIPLLKLFPSSKVFFYCHFPDKLLVQNRSFLKQLYRLPFDLLEEITTGMADMVSVNSRFTSCIYKSNFRLIQSSPLLFNQQVRHPSVLYPAIDLSNYDKVPAEAPSFSFSNTEIVILSINRFERKKNIALLLDAVAALKSSKMISSDLLKKLRVVIAGGYDPRVSENVEHLQELTAKAKENEILDQVTFLPNFTDSDRYHLLRRCTCVVYTPTNEHFGIVPIEVMYAEKPVIAVNQGGPLETVLNEETGFLADSDPNAFANAIAKVINMSEEQRREMGRRGREHVKNNFSLQAFAENLDGMLQEMIHGQQSNAIASSWMFPWAGLTAIVTAVYGIAAYFRLYFLEKGQIQ